MNDTRWIGRATPHRGPLALRRFTLAFTAALVALAVIAQPALATTFSYAGYNAVADKHGIRGYIQQGDSGNVTGEAVLSWVGLCGYSCSVHSYADSGSGLEWVQLGMYQGEFAAGSSTAVVSQYYENVDPCGTYYKDDLTPPDQNRQFYSVKWNEQSAQTFYCPNGAPFSGYTFELKKGQPSNNPFFYGVMGTNDGRADANTELHDTPPEAIAYFGCYSPGSCNNQNYGLELTNQAGDGWVLWQGNANSIGPDNPPYRHKYNDYWSFRTCGSAAEC